ncbi:hypothetical protein [Microbacterium sp. 77mftsu3.1]|uniref:hypothetical protein n=1 Tax=Microbacterium sp. 77mftsu3.1 TaxID=1761802 RepID=UPI000374225E|nr:hypothetical protein [Microbacterium sp. 77mftsu3.1]SDH41988.1 hypothetical protein SAMN04488590_3294 [Microbacterium sp. 77mftsu3.1]
MNENPWDAALRRLIDDGTLEDPAVLRADLDQQWTGEPRHPESTRHTPEAS